MGLAAPEFFSANDTEKQTLSRRITPSAEQMEEQRERWDAVAEHLKSELANASNCAIRTWLQGSYKFGTQVRPPRKGKEFDIDLGVYYEWEGEPNDGEHSPLELKTFAQNSLKKYADDNKDDVIEVTTPKPRCCRIRFYGDFHIDVPVYHLDEARDARSLATQKDEWEESDPKALYKWFVGKFDDSLRAKARRQVRYLKAWAGLKFGQSGPSSVLMTVLVAEAIDKIASDELASDDDGFKAVVDEIIKRLDNNKDVPNPVNTKEILSKRLSSNDFDSFLRSLRSLQGIAERASKTTDLVSAAEIWSEAFEHFFPAVDEEELQKSLKESSTALAVIQFLPMIAVIARANDNHNRRWEGINRIGPIPKNCTIDFTLANAHEMPPGAAVSWMIRNEGEEAERVNDLGHLGGSGLKKREESAYNGKHYMDCFIKLKGKVIGFRRVPVTIAGIPIPPRTPPRRAKNWPR